MATFSKRLLSGSVNGCGITVNSVSGGTAGTAGTIHAASAGTAGKEEIWLWAYNTSTTAIPLSIEFGTSSMPITQDIEPQSGLVPIIPGLPIHDGLKIQAFAGTAGLIAIDGFVNQIAD
jgi:hypothetical protein